MNEDKPKDYLGTYVKERDISILTYAIRNCMKMTKTLDMF